MVPAEADRGRHGNGRDAHTSNRTAAGCRRAHLRDGHPRRPNFSGQPVRAWPAPALSPVVAASGHHSVLHRPRPRCWRRGTVAACGGGKRGKKRQPGRPPATHTPARGRHSNQIAAKVTMAGSGCRRWEWRRRGRTAVATRAGRLAKFRPPRPPPAPRVASSTESALPYRERHCAENAAPAKRLGPTDTAVVRGRQTLSGRSGLQSSCSQAGRLVTNGV